MDPRQNVHLEWEVKSVFAGKVQGGAYMEEQSKAGTYSPGKDITPGKAHRPDFVRDQVVAPTGFPVIIGYTVEYTYWKVKA